MAKMHQTTVRFGHDLWESLEHECADLGVSVAQFVRDAALARLMYRAGRRGDPDYERALERAASPSPQLDAAASSRERSAAEVSDSAALWAQGQLARRRAEELRDQSERRRLLR
jgi:hypothetical protein